MSANALPRNLASKRQLQDGKGSKIDKGRNRTPHWTRNRTSPTHPGQSTIATTVMELDVSFYSLVLLALRTVQMSKSTSF